MVFRVDTHTFSGHLDESVGRMEKIAHLNFGSYLYNIIYVEFNSDQNARKYIKFVTHVVILGKMWFSKQS